MKRTVKILFAIASLALMAAQSPSAGKPLPPDNTADVKTVHDRCPDHVDLDADGNVGAVRFDDYYWRMRRPPLDPALMQALHRLRHVRSLIAAEPDVLKAVKEWTALEDLYVFAVDYEVLANLQNMRNLRRLWIGGGWLREDEVPRVANLKSLQVLVIETARVDDSCMKHIASLPRLKRLDLKGNPITDAGLAQLKGMQLEFLGLAGTQITDRAIDQIKGMTTLKEVDIEDSGISMAGLAKLKGIAGLKVRGLPKDEDSAKNNEPHEQLGSEDSDSDLAALEGRTDLRCLLIDNAPVTDLGVKSIGKLKELRVLRITSTHITDACMRDIAGLPRLKELDLSNNPITDRGLAELEDMRLETLRLRTTKITDRGIDAIKDMTSLKDLDVTNTKVTDAALPKLLAGVPPLHVWGLPREEVHEVPDDPNDVAAIEAASLRITIPKDNVTGNVYYIDASMDKQRPRVWMKHLTGLHSLKRLDLPHFVTEDNDLALLVGLRTLEQLSISSAKISDAGLKQLVSLSSLRDLELSNCQGITSAGIESLSQLNNLQGLRLDSTPVTNEGLRHLAKLTRLEGLDLCNTKVTDAGLAHLAGLTNLKDLSLGMTQTTDAGLVHLRGLKKLRYFSGGVGVTRDGLIELQKYVRGLRVPREIPPPIP